MWCLLFFNIAVVLFDQWLKLISFRAAAGTRVDFLSGYVASTIKETEKSFSKPQLVNMPERLL